jgi:hypothetical protein
MSKDIKSVDNGNFADTSQIQAKSKISKEEKIKILLSLSGIILMAVAGYMIQAPYTGSSESNSFNQISANLLAQNTLGSGENSLSGSNQDSLGDADKNEKPVSTTDNANESSVETSSETTPSTATQTAPSLFAPTTTQTESAQTADTTQTESTTDLSQDFNLLGLEEENRNSTSDALELLRSSAAENTTAGMEIEDERLAAAAVMNEGLSSALPQEKDSLPETGVPLIAILIPSLAGGYLLKKRR